MITRFIGLPFALILLFPINLFALELKENLSISGTITGVYQWLKMTKEYSDEEVEAKKKSRGSVVIDFNVSYKPSENGEFYMRASFAKGDGLKSLSPLFFLQM